MSSRVVAKLMSRPQERQEMLGLLLGFIGVAAFSLTLPATRIAVAALDPLFIGCGRAVVASIPAGAYLLWRRDPLPSGRDFAALFVVALCVALGFPLLSAFAMREVDASHGGIMLGLLPLATAAAGCVIAGERVGVGFWCWAVAGSALVVAFALQRGGGTLQAADLDLLGALIAAAVGYALGARLTVRLGGLAVISWALVLAAPFLALPAWMSAPRGYIPARALMAFAYVSLVSQYLGFLPWYRALALGGVARVGQIQLFQPFLTLLAAWAFLSEPVGRSSLAFALAVVMTVLAGRASVGKRLRTREGGASRPGDHAENAVADRRPPTGS